MNCVTFVRAPQRSSTAHSGENIDSSHVGRHKHLRAISSLEPGLPVRACSVRAIITRGSFCGGISSPVRILLRIGVTLS